jgi:hypothetical protein
MLIWARWLMDHFDGPSYLDHSCLTWAQCDWRCMGQNAAVLNDTKKRLLASQYEPMISGKCLKNSLGLFKAVSRSGASQRLRTV